VDLKSSQPYAYVYYFSLVPSVQYQTSFCIFLHTNSTLQRDINNIPVLNQTLHPADGGKCANPNRQRHVTGKKKQMIKTKDSDEQNTPRHDTSYYAVLSQSRWHYAVTFNTYKQTYQSG